jgi:hypothetical protein
MQPVNRFAFATRRQVRQAAAVSACVLVSAGCYWIKSTPSTYLESATVKFSLPAAQTSPKAYYFFAPSLIMSTEAVSQILLSPQIQYRIRAAGGDAAVGLTLVNLHSEEYPEYGEPLATLTSESTSAAETHRTFMIAARMVSQILASSQAQDGVSSRNRISEQLLADTEPIIQTGSAVRVDAGLAVLALLVLSLVWACTGRLVGKSRPPRGARTAPDRQDGTGAPQPRQPYLG